MIVSRLLVRTSIAGVTVLLASAIGVGCASPDNSATNRATTVFAKPSTTAAAPTPTTTVPVDPTCDPNDPSRSLRPLGPLPQPGQMPSGSTMAAIQARGKLRVGVDQNTLLFGYRDPRNNALTGFDIDVAHEIARAIFGDPNAIDYKVVTTAQRLPAVQNGDVDMVASLVTITCPRWSDVSFSTEYYRAAQGLLVRNDEDADIESPADLANKRVCATKGSTSSANFQRLQPAAKMLEVTDRTECLVALQDGRVDAVTADDTILYGFKAQDRTTEILEKRLSVEPYGLAINKGQPDLVRFVNGVLERMRANSTLSDLEVKWLGATVDPLPQIPPASYRD
jgi:polar amino acid transport system substrate-binding protein